MRVSDGATDERMNRYRRSVSGRSKSTEIGVEMGYARGGGPSGPTIGLRRFCEDTDKRRDVESCASKSTRPGMTAKEPTNPARVAASGSDVLRHEQSDFDRGFAGVGWCIGHIP